MTAGKLTREEALEIRDAYTAPGADGAGARVLAARYGVSVSLVYQVLWGEHWTVRGLPNVSGGRETLDSWSDLQTPEQAREVGPALRATLDRPARPGPRDRQNYPCPECGARPRERCVKLREGSYPQPIAKLHPGRGPQPAENVVPVREDA